MKSIIDYFEDKVTRYGNHPLLWEKQDGAYRSLNYEQTREAVRTMAAGLLGIGINRGDRLALLSEGRNDWLIAELSILYCGAINVPLSTKLEADQDLIFRLAHSESRMVIVSKNQLPKIRKVLPELPLIEKVIVLDDVEDLQEKELPISQIRKEGRLMLESDPGKLEERIREVSSNDVANICYTSGTTAHPKGIMLTHRNYTANVEQAFSFIDIPAHFRTLVVLPWDHAFAHTAALYAFMYRGASIASVQAGSTQMETLKNFSNNMMEIQPHVLMSVPAIAKNFRRNIEKGIQAKGSFINNLFKMGLSFAIWYNGTGNNRGAGLKRLTFPIYKLFDQVLFKTIRSRFGGNLQYFIGGGALLDIDLQKFFYALGVPMHQGYGLSEAAPIISANTPGHHKMGSSGPVLKGLELRICDENGNDLPDGVPGEIVVKGENVMKGYWKNELATREAVRDGWLYTGDLGYVDSEGYLYVQGRSKSLLISSDGEKYSPEAIEEAVMDHCHLIEQFFLYNNQSPYTIGLIVPGREKVLQLLKMIGSEMEPQQQQIEVLKMIQKQLAQFKTGGKLDHLFPQRWLPAASIILPEPMSEHNKLINSTMKVVRGKVESYFKEEIDFLYTPQGRDFFSDQNQKNIQKYMLMNGKE